ncbi:MAG TPA: (5-formylfuran-3-yl)methyl phosphate synthase, partial [Gemmatimonadales bacterium]|nr:(5-formylfuran-3-yl)methyl phosphate synthase [Gemmatimonadales bacterium]
MRLLVSVADPEEAVRALAGGAAILDAKDPAQGSLGAVTPAALADLLAAVPPDCPVSAALGDHATP